jgi:hypothetical protein
MDGFWTFAALVRSFCYGMYLKLLLLLAMCGWCLKEIFCQQPQHQ